MKKNILILSPHADDEILGCGGLISKFSKEIGLMLNDISELIFPINC